MKTPSKAALRRVMSTRLGRLFCRLVGEQTGAVMMEYVVVGVLVVAAAVAIVLVFGKNIRNQFAVMSKGVVGNASGAATQAKDNYDKNDTAVSTAMQTGETTDGVD